MSDLEFTSWRCGVEVQWIQDEAEPGQTVAKSIASEILRQLPLSRLGSEVLTIPMAEHTVKAISVAEYAAISMAENKITQDLDFTEDFTFSI